jgi:glycosyltransferase involved in cell wall biosynthesis
VKIVFLTPSAQLGGAEAALYELLHGLRGDGPDWSLHLVAAENGPLLQRMTEAGISHEVLAFPPELRSLGEHEENNNGSAARWLVNAWRLARGSIAALRYVRKLQRRIAALQATVVHSNGVKMHLLAALARKFSRSGFPLVWHLHDYVSNRRLTSRALRILGKECAAAIANSKSVAADAATVLHVRRGIDVIYNAVDTDVYKPDGDLLDLDASAGLSAPPAGTLRVGLLATFAKWKGHEIFLRGVAAIASARAIRFYIIGGPIYATFGSQWEMDALRKKADALGLGDRIGFTGFVEDASAAIRALDVVVHASTSPEPFGMVIIQAMACRRALITTGLGGAREIIDPGIDCLAYEASDPAALASAIETLAANPDLRTRLGSAGRTKAVAMFSSEVLAKNVVAFYESLIA